MNEQPPDLCRTAYPTLQPVEDLKCHIVTKLRASMVVYQHAPVNSNCPNAAQIINSKPHLHTCLHTHSPDTDHHSCGTMFKQLNLDINNVLTFF